MTFDKDPGFQNNPDDYHRNSDKNVSELSLHHTIGEGPTEAISLRIAKKYFDLRTDNANSLVQFDPDFSPNLGSYPGFGQVRYFKDLSGIVHFKGLMGATASVASGSMLFTLPVGFRPYDNVLFPAVIGNGIGTNTGMFRIDVYPTGEVYVNANLVNGDWVNFNGISFLAEN